MIKDKLGNTDYDAVIIGSGPNGLAAGITLAQAGLSVAILEAKSTIGGGMRTAELTLPGFIHDICSAIHPLGMGSPFFRSLPLDKHGLEWIQPPVPLAHPFDDGTCVLLDRSVDTTSLFLNKDSKAYKQLMHPFVSSWDRLAADLLGPLKMPSHPIEMARFAWLGFRSAQGLIKHFFEGERAKALFAGLAAHSIMPLDKSVTAGFGLILGILGHAVGWPMPRGGSQNIANALASYFQSLGGKIVTNAWIDHFDEIPKARAILFDTSPKELLRIAGKKLPSHYKNKLNRYRYGPGVFKMDWALNSTIPWKAKDCLKAGTVHIGGTLEEIAASEKEVWAGKHPEKSYLIVAQQSLFDATRAPSGKHTAWAYCHVPNGSTYDMTERIERQIERFAPGFRDCIIKRSNKSAMQFEEYNPNYVGGDINGGIADIYQLFRRPVSWIHPYATPIQGVYICSSSTPPGGGVHGMCGYHAALLALKQFEKNSFKKQT